MILIDRFIDMVRHNTNSFAEFIRLGVLMLMLFEFIHWTEPQMFGFLAFLSAGLALITSKTTVPSVTVDRKVDEKVALREVTGATGTGAGMTTPQNQQPPSGTANIILLLIAAGMLLSTIACAKVPPNTSPEGKVAVHATRIVDGLRGVLPMIKPLVCQPSTALTQLKACLKPEDAIKVAYAIEQAADAAITLGPILSAIDNSPSVDERVTGVAKAKAVLEKIQSILMNVAVTPDAEPARQELVKLFSTVTALLFAVQF